MASKKDKKDKKEKDELEEEKEIEETEEDNDETKESDEKEEVDLEAEVEKWKNQYYSVFADMQNTKKRMQTEHENNLKYMTQSFIEELLPVIDNFERSLMIQNPSDEIKNFLKGYEMIYSQLMNVLENQGVEEIQVEPGDEFDPNIHHAVEQVEDENFGENQVVAVMQKGYKLKDRVIRATLVKVNK
ncbi:MAG: nucleotide exchange factor GrpE [Thomasclavelia sp.]|nr:nucleotide exchange factor GrpE [Thomasclavelia sp.]